MLAVWYEIELNFRLAEEGVQSREFQLANGLRLRQSLDESLSRIIIRFQIDCKGDESNSAFIEDAEKNVGKALSCFDYCFTYVFNSHFINYIYDIRSFDPYLRINRFSLNQYRMEKDLPVFAVIPDDHGWYSSTPIFSHEKFGEAVALLNKCLKNPIEFEIMEYFAIGEYLSGKEGIMKWRNLIEYLEKKVQTSEYLKDNNEVRMKFLKGFPQIYRHDKHYSPNQREVMESKYPAEFNSVELAFKKYRIELKKLINQILSRTEYL